jgi:hypothetical protein
MGRRVRRWRFLAGSLGVGFVAVLTATLLWRERARPARAGPEKTNPEVEEAKRRVLPYRQSGLVYHWADDAPAVYVRRAQWDALSDDAKRRLGQAIAAAKRKPEVTVFDETLRRKLAVCKAKGGCAALTE